jgi:hypothetical protein
MPPTIPMTGANSGRASSSGIAADQEGRDPAERGHGVPVPLHEWDNRECRLKIDYECPDLLVGVSLAALGPGL